MPVDRVRERSFERLARGKRPVVDGVSGNAGLRAEFQSGGVGAIADHGRDLRREPGADDGFHVAASAGNQDDDLLHALILPSALRAEARRPETIRYTRATR